jgi:hypothetical protein
MIGMTVNNTRQAQVLAPVARQLDLCWWYLGGAGMSFPWIRPPRRLPAPTPVPLRRGPGRHSGRPAEPGPLEPEDWERYLAESRAASDEYRNWLDDRCAYRVGKPASSAGTARALKATGRCTSC